jgi:hypothetical protein
MAYLGISGEPSQKCGSKSTSEYSRPGGTGHPQREVMLKCYECQHEESHGIYTLVGNSTLVKV